MSSHLFLWMRSCIAAGLFLSATASLASKQQLRLHCQLFAGGEDHAFVFVPTAAPLTAKPIDLERFRSRPLLAKLAIKLSTSKSQSLTSLLGKPSFFSKLLICHRLLKAKV